MLDALDQIAETPLPCPGIDAGWVVGGVLALLVAFGLIADGLRDIRLDASLVPLALATGNAKTIEDGGGTGLVYEWGATIGTCEVDDSGRPTSCKAL